jgi:broad specificity phosphatase PhoE
VVNGRPARLLLLRHGQSEWNAQRRWQGTHDSPLTHVGRRQAAHVGRHLRDVGTRFAGIWSSDLQRASETARIIARHLEISPIEHDVRLREAHAGPWQGLTPADIEAAYPGYLAAHRRPDGFESPESVLHRALDALVEIAERARLLPLLVVSHSGLIRTLRRALGADDKRVDNVGGQWLVVDRGDLRLDGAFTLERDPHSSVDGGCWEGPGDEAEDPGEC